MAFWTGYPKPLTKLESQPIRESLAWLKQEVDNQNIIIHTTGKQINGSSGYGNNRIRKHIIELRGGSGVSVNFNPVSANSYGGIISFSDQITSPADLISSPLELYFDNIGDVGFRKDAAASPYTTFFINNPMYNPSVILNVAIIIQPTLGGNPLIINPTIGANHQLNFRFSDYMANDYQLITSFPNNTTYVQFQILVITET